MWGNAMNLMTAAGKDVLSFGPFRLVAAERLLTREGAPVELGARALDILIALVSTPNKVISKKDLLSRAWPDVTVEENSLRAQVLGLRKTLVTERTARDTLRPSPVAATVLWRRFWARAIIPRRQQPSQWTFNIPTCPVARSD